MIKVAFVCVHNSCRSQMAEGFAKHYGKDIIEVYSAGTENYPEVKPLAVEVMQEVGIQINDQYPKLLDDIPIPDVLITMGCNANCPWVPNRHQEDWGLDDPSGKRIEAFRVTRELIRNKVIELIQRIQSNLL
jgi:protein-tyrosine-phosphatase